MSDESDHDTATNAAEEEPAQPPPAQDDKDKTKPIVFIGLFMTALFSLGVVDFARNMEENGCAMTYMYEYPQYIPIKLTEIVKQRFPKYELYVYGEGKSSEKLRDGKFSGIPVLFIPGNSGSYKQVRSLASVALRKAIDDTEYKVHFDYFSVDFDEEYSALYGGVLQDQAQFVGHCVEKILGLYVGTSTKAKSPPSSVVLVGHSLGGVIAKSLFTDTNFNPYSVQVILTLATPHTPVLLLDKFSHDFYNKVDTFWADNKDGALSHVTLVSIGGGLRDIQVRSGLTWDNSSDLSVTTSAAPSVWVSTDHRCIVWCKQLILSINRAMFDLISPLTKQITLNKPLRREILHYHLVHRSAGKTFSKDNLHPVSMEFDQNGYWSDILKKQFSFSKGNVTCNNYLMMRVPDDHYVNFLTLDALKMDNDNWIFGCKSTKVFKNTKMCEVGDNLSHQSYIIPSNGKRKAFHLDLKEVKAKNLYSHIVIFTPAHTEDTVVNIDLYNPRERRLSYTVPKWISFWKEHVVLQKTVPNAVFYNLTLEGIDHPWQAYNVKVQPERCAEQSKPSFGLARFITPWANDDTQVLLGNDDTLTNLTNTLNVKLQTPRPVDLDPSVHPQVHMYLNPACTYSIKIQSSMPQIMGQIIRFYGPMLLPSIVSALIMILAFQLRRMESDKYCRSTIFILVTSVSPINIVLPSRFGSYLTTLSQGFLPQTDLSALQASGLDFGVLPIMLMFAAIGILSIICFFGWVCIVLFGTLAHKAVIKYFTKKTIADEIVADIAVSGLNKFPSILGAILIALGFATCGSLSLCLGCFCYFVKLFKMYEDYLKFLLKRAVGLKQEDDDPALLTGINFQFTLGLLWMMSTLLNVPTLMAWIQNLPHNSTLRHDPSLIHAVILAGALSVLWQNDGKPNVNKKFYSYMAVALQGIAIIIAMYASITQYRVTFAITGVFVLITLQQLFGPEEVKTDEEIEAEVSEKVVEVLETSQTPEAPKSPKVKLAVPAASSDTQESSESEYEYSYSLNVAKKKVDKSSTSRSASGAAGRLTKSASNVTDTGFGTEGLDWEYEGDESEDEATGERRIIMYTYPLRVWKRLQTLPTDFLADLVNLWTTVLEASVTLGTLLAETMANQWKSSSGPKNEAIVIEVTSATPEPESENPFHPPKKPGVLDDDGNAEENRTSLVEYAQKIADVIIDFHWKFYHDIFQTIFKAGSFLLYLIYPFPIELYQYLWQVKQQRSSQTTGKPENIQSMKDENSPSIFSILLKPVYFFLFGLGAVSSGITSIIPKIVSLIHKLNERPPPSPTKEIPIPKTYQPPPKIAPPKDTVPPTVFVQDFNPFLQDPDLEIIPGRKLKRADTLKSIPVPDKTMLENPEPPMSMAMTLAMSDDATDQQWEQVLEQLKEEQRKVEEDPVIQRQRQRSSSRESNAKERFLVGQDHPLVQRQRSLRSVSRDRLVREESLEDQNQDRIWVEQALSRGASDEDDDLDYLPRNHPLWKQRQAAKMKREEEMGAENNIPNRPIINEPIMITGPWIRTEIEEINSGTEDDNVEQPTIIIEPPPKPQPKIEKSGVFEQLREPPRPLGLPVFDAPIPDSSIFERDSETEDFVLKAKGSPSSSTPSLRSSRMVLDDEFRSTNNVLVGDEEDGINSGKIQIQKDQEEMEEHFQQNFVHVVEEEEGPLALSGNIHMSMGNIAAACEQEEELSRLRESSPECNSENMFRSSDIEDLVQKEEDMRKSFDSDEDLSGSSVNRQGGPGKPIDNASIIRNVLQRIASTEKMIRPQSSNETEIVTTTRKITPGYAVETTTDHKLLPTSEAPHESPIHSMRDELAQLRETVREDLISIRADEPDEAIGHSADSVSDDQGCIVTSRYGQDEKMSSNKSKQRDNSPSARRRNYKNSYSKSSRKNTSPPPPPKLEDLPDDYSDAEFKPKQMETATESDNSVHKSILKHTDIETEEEKDWEFDRKDEVSGYSTNRRKNKKDTPVLQRRHRSTSRSSRNAKKKEMKARSQSVGSSPRFAGEFSESGTSLNDRASALLSSGGEDDFGASSTSLQNVQVRRNNSFWDIQIPIRTASPRTSSKSSMESLLIFEQTIAKTAESFQAALSKTAESFTKTLDETALKLKSDIANTDISKTLQETADILTKTSDTLNDSVKESLDNLGSFGKAPKPPPRKNMAAQDSGAPKKITDLPKMKLDVDGSKDKFDMSPSPRSIIDEFAASKRSRRKSEDEIPPRSLFEEMANKRRNSLKKPDEPTASRRNSGNGVGVPPRSLFEEMAKKKTEPLPKVPPRKTPEQKEAEIQKAIADKKPLSLSQMRLDTITSEDLSDTDTECQIDQRVLNAESKYTFKQNPLEKFRESEYNKAMSPIDSNFPDYRQRSSSSESDDITQYPGRRPGSPNSLASDLSLKTTSDVSFRTPFGKTPTAHSAKDILKQMKQPTNKPNPFTFPQTPKQVKKPQIKPSASSSSVQSEYSSSKNQRTRAESKSPERYTRERTGRGRDPLKGTAPSGRTQSANPVPLSRTQSANPLSRDFSGFRIRSSSQAPVSRPGSAQGESSNPLPRCPSYRLLGGRLVEGYHSTDTSWKDDPNYTCQTERYSSACITREPYIITTKDGRKQSLAEYEKKLVEQYKRKSQQNLASS